MNSPVQTVVNTYGTNRDVLLTKQNIAAAAPAPYVFLQPGTYRITTPSTTLTLHARTASLNPSPTAIQNPTLRQ